MLHAPSKMSHIFVSLLLLLPCLAAPVHAQTGSPESPPAKPGQPAPRLPLVASAPARAEWTIHISSDFSESGEGTGQRPPAAAIAGQPRTASSIQFSKDGAAKTYRLRTRWSDGDTEDEWIIMGSHVAERAGHRGLYIVGNESSTARELNSSDFPELAWVDMTHYRGLKLLNGKKALFFSVPFDQKRLTGEQAQLMAFSKRSDAKATPTKVFRPKVQEVSLYLDVATQLPLLYNDGLLLRRYSFSQATEEPLQPPAKIVDFLRARNEALRVRLTPPVGPGSP